MAVSDFAVAMGVIGTVLLCIYEVYPIAYVKRAIDRRNSLEIPYKVSVLAIGYHICWILYYDTIQSDNMLLVLNVVTLVMCMLAFMSFLFMHFDTRSAILFCVLFAGFATGWYMIGRELRSRSYFKWFVCPFHCIAYLNILHDTYLVVWCGKPERLPILLVVDFMVACFGLALYSVAHQYWEFFIPHILGFAESGFAFCLVVAWHLVPRRYKSVKPGLLSSGRKKTSKATTESMLEPSGGKVCQGTECLGYHDGGSAHDKRGEADRAAHHLTSSVLQEAGLACCYFAMSYV